MKKFLKDCNFEELFVQQILYHGRYYYAENRILDIWCQNDLITAYIDGSEIYRIEVKIDNDM